MPDRKRPVWGPQKAGRALRFLYDTALGRLILKGLASPAFSRAGGAFLDSPVSRRLIRGFVERNNIDMKRYEEGPFRSYNDFFCRRLKRPPAVDKDPKSLIAPCDAKLSVYSISSQSRFSIKESSYSIGALLQDDALAGEYEGGLCLIFRLTVDDYHRYCYIDDGSKGPNIFIPGRLHTVQPIALKRYDIYLENSREYTVMETDHFGKVVQVEVGALLVGKICNRQQEGRFSRGSEKGMFQFGGSTIVQLFQPGKVQLDAELVINTENHLETVVKIGETIGRAQI